MHYFSKKRGFPRKSPEYPESVASLPWLPQDILTEICVYLGPQELYSLCRATKCLRAFLTSRSNAGPIWGRAFEEAIADDSVPRSPYLQSELQLAHLLFGNFCSICFKDLPPGKNIYWPFNARYCASCFPLQVQTRLPQQLERRIPRHEWWGLFPFALQTPSQVPKYLWRDIRIFTREYLAVKTPEAREECVRRRRARTADIHNLAEACQSWQARNSSSPDPDVPPTDGSIREAASRREGLCGRSYTCRGTGLPASRPSYKFSS
ncbi:hypothetical protein FB451DRAFT_773894 [Mycena latifolia]|nr:hypothetical protein FB451DRAFT_773894 [Mycena latifolia]